MHFFRFREYSRLPIEKILVVASWLVVAESGAAEPTPKTLLRTIAEVESLSAEQANAGLPVRLTPVVTYYDHRWEMLFVEDDSGGLFVYVDNSKPALPIREGLRVELTGRTVAGDYLPSIADPQISPLEMADLPDPPTARLEQIAGGELDSRWVTVQGVVRQASILYEIADLYLATESGQIRVRAKLFDRETELESFVDSVVRVRGVCTTVTDEHRQFLGAELWSPDLRSHLMIEEPAPAEPFEAPARAISSLRGWAFGGSYLRRLRVTGTVTFRDSQKGVFVQDRTGAVFVETADPIDADVDVGDIVDVVGFVGSSGNQPILEDGLVRRSDQARGPPMLPIVVAGAEAADGRQDGSLVKIRGRLVASLVSDQQVLFLRDNGVLFNARLPVSRGLLAAELGSLLEVTGVCHLPAGSVDAEGPFQILLRSGDDLVVLESPSWWTAERVRRLVELLSALVVLSVLWAGMLRYRVGRQTKVIEERLESEAALERRYRDLVENANDVVFTLDRSGRFQEINAAGENVLGYSREELSQLTLTDLLVDGDSEATSEEPSATNHHELEVRSRDGRRVVLELSSRVKGVGLEAIARDITARRTAEIELRHKDEALRESQERFALAVEGTNDGIWDWDLRRNTLYTSPRWKSMLGYSDKDIGESPDDWLDLVHPDDRQRLEGKLARHRLGTTSHFEDEHRMLHQDGSFRWVLSRGFALTDSRGSPFRMAGAQTDVTDRRAYDPLTKLPNRALFSERLERAFIALQQRDHQLFAVIFLDVDRFKHVNDSLGHGAGDRLLQIIGSRIEDCVRPGDMVARFGGDEFAVLIENLGSAKDAAQTAKRILASLTEPFQLSNQEVFVSASIGISLSSTGYQRPSEFLRDADTAMYRAKSSGGSRFEVFDRVMREEVTAFLHTENDLRRALEGDELRIHFQPIVDLESQEYVAFEALVRWQHPVRGLLTPGEFIKVAEDTGLIVQIDEWVLQRSCQIAAAWGTSASGSAPSVCVNLSARLASRDGLLQTIEALLASSGLPAERLVLELTERAIIENTDSAAEHLGQLQQLGIRLRLDDFGTGYSSLSYLHRFPIEALKIDRSFVAGMVEDEDARAIVASILSLASSLQLGVVAEGVETKQQARLLTELGCTTAQGFLFSRPLPTDDMEPYRKAAGD